MAQPNDNVIFCESLIRYVTESEHSTKIFEADINVHKICVTLDSLCTHAGEIAIQVQGHHRNASGIGELFECIGWYELQRVLI